jgi:phosphatidate phosphatase APP1
MALGGILKSLTQGTQAYKTDRMTKIHDWLPDRKLICVGDSTQSDPEAYAEMFDKHENWIKAIYIRVVENEPHMSEKNKPERFEKAFKKVPRSVWRLFTDPRKDLAEHVKYVADGANIGITGALQDYLYPQG